MQKVYTSAEAAQIWGFEASRVKRACQFARFTENEYRKSKGTWLVTHEGMVRLFGEPHQNK
jgi:hypothetical protein